MNIKQAIKPIVPGWMLKWHRERLRTRSILSSLKPLYPRACPICGYKGYFLHGGSPPRIDARCPSCDSLERHRLFWLWFNHDRSKLDEPILHFAPERLLEQELRKTYGRYSTADLYSGADLRLDIEALDVPTGSINTVICNHVLEHVDDKRALAEVFRVLAPEGRLVVSVPIIEGWQHTYENGSIEDPLLREVHFGQSDHVRYYGSDFRLRLRAAGFNQIDEVTAEGQAVIEFGLMRGEKLFVCSKTGVRQASADGAGRTDQ